MATKKEIMRQLLKGVSWNEAARSLGCSKATVAKCAAKMDEGRIDSERLESMTDAEVSGLFADGRSKRGEEYLEPDYERVCDQLARVPKMTLSLQWARYLDCNPGGKRLYQYSQFCKKVGEYARARGLAARIAHEPGRTMHVDWAGLTASVFDPVTGGRSPAYLFVAVFPWSGWIWAECFADMRSRSWIQAHVHAFQAAGGVPDVLVPDNCATATDRRRRSDPVKVNDAYLEMAEHYGCAVVPAREGKPRDKGAVEKAVDLCEMWVLAPLADERLTSLDELNREVRRLVDALNARERAEGSRDDAFFGEERAALNPLPGAPFELYEWRRCKVSPDYHVQCDHMRYSVPHRLVGRTVDARLGAASVAILDGGETVAEHRRLRGRESTPIPFTPLRRIHGGALPMPRLELRRAEVPQRRVDPDPVVESPDVLEDLERCLLARLEGSRMHALGLDEAHERLHGRVVPRGRDGAHRGLDAGIPHGPAQQQRGVLAAVVAVVHAALPRAPSRDRHL